MSGPGADGSLSLECDARQPGPQPQDRPASAKEARKRPRHPQLRRRLRRYQAHFAFAEWATCLHDRLESIAKIKFIIHCISIANIDQGQTRLLRRPDSRATAGNTAGIRLIQVKE